MLSPLTRFERNYIPEPNSGCWLWTAACDSNGRGHMRLNGRTEVASRIAWFLHKGEIDAGLYVLHRCDNGLCVNPAHLFLGTQADNVADCEAKGRGRHPYGAANGQAKLDGERALMILNDPRSLRVIARAFGVSQTTVCNIKARRVWRHVEVAA